jgi:hypothetical protein
MRTVYQARTIELKNRLKKPDQPFQLLFDYMVEFLGLRMLSEHNQSWARQRIVEWRDTFPNEREKLDFLDGRVERAKAKFEGRRQAREEKKGLPARTKRGSKSQTEPAAPTPAPGGTTPWDF